MELQSSFVLALQLHQLHVVLSSLSAPQILALHRGVMEGSSKEQTFQQLVQLQKVLQAQPLANLRTVHQMYRDEGPDCDKVALAKMLNIGHEGFFVVELVRQVLSLDADGVRTLRESLSLFSAAHLNLLVDLLLLADFGALELRALFVDLMIEEPEAFLGGGFGLGLSGGEPKPMERGDEEEEEEEYGEEWQSTVRVEIVEQPPKACVYRRNVRPSPEVVVKGVDGGNAQLRVHVVVLRCDTMAVLEEASSLSGDLEYRVAAGSKVAFKKLKLMKTSNQLGDTHVALRFELRDHSGGGGDYRVLHTCQSVPFMVMSHSTQLKKPKELTPVVGDIVPSQGHVGGGTRVVLMGNNFMDTPGLRVRFDKTDVQPVYHGPRTLTCQVPPHTGAGPVSVRVCNDATKFGDASDVPFVFVTQPDPVWIDPAAPLLAPIAMPVTALPSGQQQQPQPGVNRARPFYDLRHENLGGREWTTDGSEFMFGMTIDGPSSLTGSFGEELFESK